MARCLLSMLQSTFRLPHLLHGTVLAAMIALAAATVVPATKVVPPPTELPPDRTALQTFYVLLSAWTTALVFALLSRKK